MVPVDGSAESWRVVDTALELARQCSGRIEVVEVVDDPDETVQTERRHAAAIHDRAIADIDITSTVEFSADPVAQSIAALVAKRPLATVVMASSGKGRSAAILGSVAEDLLRHLDGPIVIVGPQSTVSDFTGPTIVTVDGSDTSEAALPIAATWSLELGVTSYLVHVVQPGDEPTVGDDQQAYPAHAARRLTTLSGHATEPTVLHDRDVEGAIAGFAESIGASLIVTSTYGRTGTSRFVLGSTAAGLVRRAPCPVLAVHPKHFVSTEHRFKSDE